MIGRLPAIRAMGFGVLYLPPSTPSAMSTARGEQRAAGARG
ncbi:hypothetical protein RAA17_13145 [Komagataeibacter rhaeticus]|nr:hypothetical protein [Komagataeibacter rhaeticus]